MSVWMSQNFCRDNSTLAISMVVQQLWLTTCLTINYIVIVNQKL